MTILEEIKQRDASIHQSWFDIYERVLNLDATPDEKVPPPDDAHTALALGDRRWLLARVEALSTALREALGTHGEVCEPNAYCSVRSHAQDALASLTEPVSSQEEQS